MACDTTKEMSVTSSKTGMLAKILFKTKSGRLGRVSQPHVGVR
ncbi:MAG: hypothetical protein QW429_04220 [Thermoprotei archaeon]